MKPAIALQLLDRPGLSSPSVSTVACSSNVPALQEQGVEHLVLGLEVVVDEPVGHARLVGDVGHAAGVEALAGEHAHGGVEDEIAACPDRPARAATRRDLRPASGRPPGQPVGQRGQRTAGLGLALEVELGERRTSPCPGRWASTTPQGGRSGAPAGAGRPWRARPPGWRRRRSTGPRSPGRAAGPPSARA